MKKDSTAISYFRLSVFSDPQISLYDVTP